jgi:hypothetical protein
MLALALLACRSGTTPSPSSQTGTSGGTPSLVSAPVLVRPNSGDVRLVQRLVAETDRPTRLSVRLDDGVRARTIRWDALATSFDAPLLELHPNTTYAVTATFTAEDGASTSADLSLDSGALFDTLPTIEVKTSHPLACEPGLTLVPVGYAGLNYVLALDLDGEVVWAWQAVGEVKALTQVDGQLGALLGSAAARFDPLGDVTTLWAPTGLEVDVPNLVRLPVDELHHEVAFEPDGSFWSFYKVQRSVPDYPASEDDPSITAPAEIDDDHVVHVAPDGTFLSDWSMADRVDPRRIGYGSLDLNTQDAAYDWAHANAIVPLPDEDAVLVSLRHQDTVVKLTGPDGDVSWILANPDGWSPELQPYLLTPVGSDFQWQYHQHAPMIGVDGRITLFDNGNERRTTPYSHDPDPDGLYSRVVQYEVDEAARTVRQVWSSYGDPDRLYTQALGNADLEPITGNVFATFPYLHEEDGVHNDDAGLGELTVRMIEIASTGEVVWDTRLSIPSAADPAGLLVDRAIRVPTLYGPGVEQEWE